jgi:hypothetical protein
MLVSPPGNRSLSSSCARVESASAGRKLAVSSFVTSATFDASGESAATATNHSAITSHCEPALRLGELAGCRLLRARAEPAGDDRAPGRGRLLVGATSKQRIASADARSSSMSDQRSDRRHGRTARTVGYCTW